LTEGTVADRHSRCEHISSPCSEEQRSSRTDQRNRGEVLSEAVSENVKTEATVVFTALPGFAAWSAQRQATEVALALNAHYNVLGDAIYAHGGKIVKYLGDGVLAVFLRAARSGRPTVRAVRALLQARSGQAQLGTSGVHHGEIYLGPLGHPRQIMTDVAGSAVNLAARAAQRASRTGGIVLTAAAQEQCQAAVICRKLGQQPIKGFPEPIVLFEVAGLR